MMYAFTNVRAEMKTTATIMHSALVATSQLCDEGGAAKLGCPPGGGLAIPARLVIALFVRCERLK